MKPILILTMALVLAGTASAASRHHRPDRAAAERNAFKTNLVKPCRPDGATFGCRTAR
jgi:Ribonuclease G/E